MNLEIVGDLVNRSLIGDSLSKPGEVLGTKISVIAKAHLELVDWFSCDARIENLVESFSFAFGDG
jgi:hypothetical protein